MLRTSGLSSRTRCHEDTSLRYWPCKNRQHPWAHANNNLQTVTYKACSTQLVSNYIIRIQNPYCLLLFTQYSPCIQQGFKEFYNLTSTSLFLIISYPAELYSSPLALHICPSKSVSLFTQLSLLPMFPSFLQL